MTEHDPRAWRVAVALAHATGLDWARWAMGACYCCRSRCCRGVICHNCKGDACEPVAAPWDVEAYLADCRRREVEPGPLPSLTGPGWRVYEQVESSPLGRHVVATIGPFTLWDDAHVSSAGIGGMSIGDLVRATNLARVAAEAMR